MFKELVGKTISQIYRSDSYLRFVTDVGELYYDLEAPCCCESNIESFDNIQNILGNTILDIYEKDAENDSEGCFCQAIVFEVNAFLSNLEIITIMNGCCNAEPGEFSLLSDNLVLLYVYKFNWELLTDDIK
jgi:hypothetical protein